ncbi:LamG-like jellyroll fold domain-containing protein [Hydrogenophaga defluvii]|uniref:LamG-like jellyroll fold domain-containing protein n=1 Tax=Hydrogenophaga defluvii TaxID=249410 RepID=UPI0036D2354F
MTVQGGDPNYSNVSLLLHGNGANNSTTFTDSGPDARTVTRNGTNVVISTTQSKFGGASIYLPGGSGDYLTAASNADFDFGTGDFTIEFWAYATKSQPLDFLNFISSGTTRLLIYLNGGELSFWDTTAGVNIQVAYSWPSGGASWVHFAWCRSGTTMRVFANGVLLTTQTYSASSPSGCDVHIARSWTGGGGREFGGYIDDLRIKKGEALYTAAFTPPAAELPGAGTLLPAGEYSIDCGAYTDDVIVYQYDPADLTIRPQIHFSEPV